MKFIPWTPEEGGAWRTAKDGIGAPPRCGAVGAVADPAAVNGANIALPPPLPPGDVPAGGSDGGNALPDGNGDGDGGPLP